MVKAKRKTGTREWAEVSKNFCLGCENDCKYCYAKADAVRFGRATRDSWKDMKVIQKKFEEKPRRVGGRIMFPTTHDITPTNVDDAILYMEGWLRHGNEMLVVSKPHISATRKICEAFDYTYRPQITFRFTMGSNSDESLKFWEPNAPSAGERLVALSDAFDKGFKTSVSCEPYLDDSIIQLVETVLPFVSDTVWIGKMNHALPRITLNCGKDSPGMAEHLAIVQASQTDEKIRGIYAKFKDNPKVKWKESIKGVLGLAEEACVG